MSFKSRNAKRCIYKGKLIQISIANLYRYYLPHFQIKNSRYRHTSCCCDRVPYKINIRNSLSWLMVLEYSLP